MVSALGTNKSDSALPLLSSDDKQLPRKTDLSFDVLWKIFTFLLFVDSLAAHSIPPGVYVEPTHTNKRPPKTASSPFSRFTPEIYFIAQTILIQAPNRNNKKQQRSFFSRVISCRN